MCFKIQLIEEIGKRKSRRLGLIESFYGRLVINTYIYMSIHEHLLENAKRHNSLGFECQTFDGWRTRQILGFQGFFLSPITDKRFQKIYSVAFERISWRQIVNLCSSRWSYLLSWKVSLRGEFIGGGFSFDKKDNYASVNWGYITLIPATGSILLYIKNVFIHEKLNSIWLKGINSLST